MKTSKLFITISLLFQLKILAQTLPYGQEFQVNTYEKKSQQNPVMKALPNSGFIVCWESEGQDDSGLGIFAQIFDDNGIKKGEEFKVNSNTENDQKSLSITVFPSGSFIICWSSNNKYIYMHDFSIQMEVQKKRYSGK